MTTLNRYLISSLRVFGATFIGTILVSVQSGIALDESGLTALVVAGVSAGLKAVIESFSKR